MISKRILREFWEKHSQSELGLLLWYQRISDSQLLTFNDIREIFPSADLVGNFTVFNIKGNHYRLITYIDYKSQILFIRIVLDVLNGKRQLTEKEIQDLAVVFKINPSYLVE
ncbi:MAG: type II toxin-antitoxin system HigB family toxin [Sphaerospermopsis kisseleviana]